VENKEQIAATLKGWSSVPMKVVRTPLRGEYPRVTEHKLVGEKAYKQFVLNCDVRDLTRRKGRLEILTYSPEPSGRGFLGVKNIELPPHTSFEEAFEQIWEDIVAGK